MVTFPPAFMRGPGWAEMVGFVNTPKSNEIVSFNESPRLGAFPEG